MRSGLWPLFRYDPRLAHTGEHPFHLDSRKPTVTFADFAATETRFPIVSDSDADQGKSLLVAAQQDIDDQWHYYEQLAGVDREINGK